MYKKRQNNSVEAMKKKTERIAKYYEDLNADEAKVAKYTRERITEWLAESDKTRFQIEEKIYKKIVKEKHEELVSNIISYFEENGYIDEDRFVENFVRFKFNDSNGLTKIKNELKKRGVKIDEYSHILEEYDFKTSAFEYVERKYSEKEMTQKDVDKLQRKLISRGFSFQEANHAISQLDVKKIVIDEDSEEDVDLEPAIKFIEKQMRKGYGKRRIEQDLRQKGIFHTKEIFDDFDFFECASEYKIKKFGKEKPSEYSVINKQKQHMVSRGFTFEEIGECY